MKNQSFLKSYFGLGLLTLSCVVIYQTIFKHEISHLSSLQTLMDVVNKPDRMGNTPLMNAAIANDPKEVKKLLEDPNIDLNAVSSNLDKDTILLISVANAANAMEQNNEINGQSALEVVTLLCEAGADVNKASAVGLRPVHACFRMVQPQFDRRMAILKVLIDHGAHINSKTVDGGTILHILAGMNLPDGIRVLLKEYGQVLDYDARQIFMHFDLDKKVNYTPSTQMEDKKGYTPLELARRLGHWGADSVEEALSVQRPKPLGWDNNISVTDDKGRGPLVLAMLRNDETFVSNIADLMKKKGMPLHQVSSDGKTTLMYAVISDNPVKYVRDFLSDDGIKKSVNDKDKNGNTALLLITFIEKPGARIQVGNLLVRSGADLSAKDGKGRNLRERARRLGDMDLVTWYDNQDSGKTKK